jgi:hypothetical protein
MSSQQSQQPYNCNPHTTHQRRSSIFSQPRHQQQFSHNPSAGVTLEPVNSFTYTTPASYELYGSYSFPLETLQNNSEIEGPPGVNRVEDGDKSAVNAFFLKKETIKKFNNSLHLFTRENY